LLSERYPAIYPISVRAHRARRRVQWMTRRGHWAQLAPEVETPHRVTGHSSPVLRRLGDVDMTLQHNKAHNLSLAVRTLDGLVLRPGEEISFWRAIGYPSARRGFLPGLVLIRGEMSADVGGGLCQLSNLLHWMVLHTPLEITEHHHHGYDSFPDSGRVLPFGSGATVFYNYVDYRFRNPGPDTYRLCLWLDGEQLHGELRADRMPPLAYHVEEEGHRFLKRGDQVYRENRLYRVAVARETGASLGRTLLAENSFPVLYPVDPSCFDEVTAVAS
jgi:vancomycin resistance protein VanW